MSNTDEAGYYFQTTDAIASSQRKNIKSNNSHGQPLRLPSKILATCPAQGQTASIYVAEAAGAVTKVDIENVPMSIEPIYAAATAPLTCLAVSWETSVLYAGCWDKQIHAVSLKTPRRRTPRLTGHTDFVKCLVATSLNDKPILISGAADATIIVWDLQLCRPIHRLKGHTKSLQDLAIDPLSLPESTTEPTSSFVLFSASSDREIRRWYISIDSAYELSESLEKPILAHETSVYKLRFDNDGDLWTASADKTVKHLVRTRDWEADTTLQHPDFVRDVVVDESYGIVTTACRDENVLMWNISSGELLCEYKGHFEEVTSLVLANNEVVSASIDGTVRTWPMDSSEMQAYRQRYKVETENGVTDNDKRKPDGAELTAEEEDELAELMNDD